jgi:UDP-N-acetyl-alpha-D-muramoyl-L-alanyl-L-glutamate epimerase
MSKYQQFIFDHYLFSPDSQTLELHYSLDDSVHFVEKYAFKFDFVKDYNQELLDIAAQTIFFMAGVSYYKTYLPPEIIVRFGHLDAQSAKFFSKTYQRGLGEFFFVNSLDPRMPISFPVTAANISLPKFETQFSGQLVGLGGGKDSLVSVELLRGSTGVATWSVGHQQQLEPLAAKIGMEHFWVEREWDRSLLEHNEKPGAYNGHIPISAILATVGAMVAILTGKQDVVVSNEASANEPTLHYQGLDINHQYSKSLEFEQDFQAYLNHRFNGSIRYYSLLRPFSELRIAEIFSDIAFDKYKSVFSSCNRAFTHSSDSMFWCGECPKCAFVFLALTPFIARNKLEEIFHGKNLLLEPALENTYKQLLGIEGDKPLECVGEIKESRAAMRQAQSIYPTLSKYDFELPKNYDYKQPQPHSIPEDILPVVTKLY